jgi:hypothetical protein
LPLRRSRSAVVVLILTLNHFRVTIDNASGVVALSPR